MDFSRTKKIITGITATALLFAAGATAASAEEEMPSADASVSFLSKYVWRGFELSDDSIVIQPSLSVSYMGFGANLWANLDTDYAATDSKKWNETDFTLSYDGAYEKLGYGFGWIYYSVYDLDDTQELYATLSYDTILAPSLTIYYDIDAADGAWYANLGFGHSFALSEAMSLDLGLSFGYYDNNDDYAEFHDGLISAALSIPFGKYVTISPELYYSFPLSGEAEDLFTVSSFSGDDSYLYGGVTLSFAF